MPFSKRRRAALLEDILAKGETMEKLMDRFGVARSTLYKHGLRKHPLPTTKPTRKRRRNTRAG